VTNNVNAATAVAGSERMTDRLTGTSLFPRKRILPWCFDPNHLRVAKSTDIRQRLTTVSLRPHLTLIRPL
jgi:hypothetical protein